VWTALDVRQRFPQKIGGITLKRGSQKRLKEGTGGEENRNNLTLHSEAMPEEGR